MSTLTIKVLRGFVLGVGRVASIGQIIENVPAHLARRLIHTGKAEIYIVEAKPELEAENDDDLEIDDEPEADNETETGAEPNNEPEPDIGPDAETPINPLVTRQRAGKRKR